MTTLIWTVVFLVFALPTVVADVAEDYVLHFDMCRTSFNMCERKHCQIDCKYCMRVQSYNACMGKCKKKKQECINKSGCLNKKKVCLKKCDTDFHDRCKTTPTYTPSKVYGKCNSDCRKDRDACIQDAIEKKKYADENDFFVCASNEKKCNNYLKQK